MDIRSSDRVLDVAAGNGNATLAAARHFAQVTSTDYVPSLLERGRARAEAEGLDVTFEVADAEDLPYPAGELRRRSSRRSASCSRPIIEPSASEMLRVCRPGGRIGLASWTPEGFLGQMFRVIAEHVPPPPGVPSPLLWGTRAHLEELFGGATSITHAVRLFSFRYRSAEHFVEIFRDVLRPGAQGVRGARRRSVRPRSRPICSRCCATLDRGDAAGLVVPAEYLETVIVR